MKSEIQIMRNLMRNKGVGNLLQFFLRKYRQGFSQRDRDCVRTSHQSDMNRGYKLDMRCDGNFFPPPTHKFQIYSSVKYSTEYRVEELVH